MKTKTARTILERAASESERSREIKPSVKETNPLVEQKVGELLNQWSSHGFFRYPALGSKVEIKEIRPRDACILNLKTELEDRSVESKFEPYRGGELDDKGTPPNPDRIEVTPPKDFEERTETIQLAHTEHVQDCVSCQGTGINVCVQCGGKGKSRCSACHGQGHTQCLGCLGSGKRPCTFCGGSAHCTVTRSRMVPNIGRPGFSSRIESVQQPCTCFGGEVTCTQCGGSGTQTCRFCAGHGVKTCGACSGRGEVQCAHCQGAGSTKTWRQLTVHFHPKTLSDQMNQSGVPDRLIRAASGGTLFEERSERIGKVSGLDEELTRCSTALWDQIPAPKDGESRILFQELIIQQVPIQEVAYRFGKADEKRLWIYGKEQAVYAPKAPMNRKRIIAVIAGTVLLLGLAMLLLAH